MVEHVVRVFPVLSWGSTPPFHVLLAQRVAYCIIFYASGLFSCQQTCTRNQYRLMTTHLDRNYAFPILFYEQRAAGCIISHVSSLFCCQKTCIGIQLHHVRTRLGRDDALFKLSNVC